MTLICTRSNLDVNPSNRPPDAVAQEALQLSLELKQTVYVYQCSEGWGISRKLAEIPSGALITEVGVFGSEAHEYHNTGGC